jgi:hypothetical protein
MKKKQIGGTPHTGKEQKGQAEPPVDPERI